MVGSVSLSDLESIGALEPIWSLNEREAGLLATRLGAAVEPGADAGAAAHPPSIPVAPVDTNGAGDAHSGVLAAALAHGTDLATALRWANVAGALTTTRFGPATCPSGAQIRALA